MSTDAVCEQLTMFPCLGFSLACPYCLGPLEYSHTQGGVIQGSTFRCDTCKRGYLITPEPTEPGYRMQLFFTW